MIRRKLIAEKAVSLLNEAGVRAAPIDVEKLAAYLGAVVVKEPTSEETSGFIYQAPGRPPVIGVNSKHPPVRIRFTIAHEMGHLLLHTKSELHVDQAVIRMRDQKTSRGTDDDEMEANRFAAEVLMPESFLKEDLNSLGPVSADDGIAVGRLAKKYQVSPQAMTIRLTTLNLLDA